MKQVERANTYGIPLFNDGTGRWHINVVGAPATERPVCSVIFPLGDSKDPLYAEYMQGVQERVEDLATVINAGYRALAQDA